jgi:chemotaxis protein methyltransferase CheR
MSMTSHDFFYIATLVKKQSGIDLKEDKSYLVESRLLPLAREKGMSNLNELVRSVRENKDPALAVRVVEAMTTNESSFFRDTTPFEHLKTTVMPHILPHAKAKGKLRIWSAACSNGQEPYSIAMTLKEMPECMGLPIEIVATDINSQVVEKAKKGIYSQFEVQRGLPITMLIKYFSQEGDQWKVKDELKTGIHFEKRNLLDDLRALGTFDIIFCRNVLIYFDQDTKEKVMANLAKQMATHSLLYLGSTENMIGMHSQQFKQFDDVGIYRLV